MGLVSAIAIYFIIWWTALFVILPIGVRAQSDGGEVVPGTADSAPTFPHLRLKMAATTALATVVFVSYYLATQVFGLGLDSFPTIIPQP